MRTLKSKDVKIMWDVLKKTITLSEYLWRNKIDLGGVDLSKKTLSLYKDMTEKINRLESQEIDGLKKESLPDFELKEAFIYLPPLDSCEYFVPLLSLKYSFDTSEVSLRVGLLNLDEKGKLRMFGLRIETGLPRSNHDYSHVQFTKNPFRKQISESTIELPEIWPCILIPAKCPVSLVFCMLISFYGNRIVSKFPDAFNIDKKYWKTVKNLLGSEEK